MNLLLACLKQIFVEGLVGAKLSGLQQRVCRLVACTAFRTSWSWSWRMYGLGVRTCTVMCCEPCLGSKYLAKAITSYMTAELYLVEWLMYTSPTSPDEWHFSHCLLPWSIITSGWHTVASAINASTVITSTVDTTVHMITQETTLAWLKLSINAVHVDATSHLVQACQQLQSWLWMLLDT